MTKERLETVIDGLTDEVSKKTIELELCRRKRSLEYCYSITLKIRNLHIELEIAYKLFLKMTGAHHIQDLPF